MYKISLACPTRLQMCSKPIISGSYSSIRLSPLEVSHLQSKILNRTADRTKSLIVTDFIHHPTDKRRTDPVEIPGCKKIATVKRLVFAPDTVQFEIKYIGWKIGVKLTVGKAFSWLPLKKSSKMQIASVFFFDSSSGREQFAPIKSPNSNLRVSKS